MPTPRSITRIARAVAVVRRARRGSAPPSGVNFDGVVQQVADDLRDPRRVDVGAITRAGASTATVWLRALEERARRSRSRRCDDRRADRRGSLLQLEHAAADPRHVEQIVDQPDHVIELAVHRAERARRRRGWPSSAAASRRSSPVRSGASGLRSSCARIARNSSFCCAAARSAASERSSSAVRSWTRSSSVSLSSASARVLRNSSAKTRDLVAQDLRVDRLGQVVDRARAVAGDHVLVVDQVRGQEHDRDLRGTACVPLIICASSKPLDAGHLDVEHDRRDVVLEQQRAAPRRRRRRAAAGSRDRRGSPRARRGFAPRRRRAGCRSGASSYRYSQTRSSDSS